MTKGGEKRHRNSIFRAVFVAVSLLLQIGWLLLIILELNNYSTYISLATSLLATIAVLRLYGKHTNSAYKMPWIMLIMALPVMGLSLFLISQVAVTPRSIHRRVASVREDNARYLDQNTEVLESLEKQDLSVANQCRYLWNLDNSPVYTGTQVRYYGQAKDAFQAIKEDLERAERFIFMEYFIVEDAQSFGEIREVLARKAAEGVDVRLMYDDFGSIGKVNLRYAWELNKQGIKCQVFNPAVPVVKLFMNNRDHRKITVIDGKVGYTGGFNLADEYFDITHPYGHWKDTGIRLEGEAVRSLTATFLELWSITANTKEDPTPYLEAGNSVAGDGFVQPFAESPLDGEQVAESVYLNLIAHAKKYIWFMSPYLMITDEMSRALGLAAKRGVDVRIITPGVPDKKAVYAVTRSYYAGLVSQGVRIYEYTPGFCHAKQCICDGELACIGTSNLDYRSLYLHFENNVLLYRCNALEDMKQDFEETFALSTEVTNQYRSVMMRTWQCILRLFAPML